jgi:hypothetical protein
MRRRSVSFAGAFERPEAEAVGLGAAGKKDALNGHIACGESGERIFQHSGIGLARFSHGGLLDIGGEDQSGQLIKGGKGALRTLAVQQIDADVRGSGLRPVGRCGSTRGSGDPPLRVPCNGVDDTCAKHAIGSNKQDLAMQGGCFRSSGLDCCFRVGVIGPNAAGRSRGMRTSEPRAASVPHELCYGCADFAASWLQLPIVAAPPTLRTAAPSRAPARSGGRCLRATAGRRPCRWVHPAR